MNATPFSSSADFTEDNNHNNNIGSDSDTNPDDATEYYQPISAVDSDGEHHAYHQSLDNGYSTQEAENGISSLHLNDNEEEEEEEDEDEDEEEENDRRREESDWASRRNAPLTPENAMRVMEAMRGVSFAGPVPDWADQIPEHQWIHQLRTLRQPHSSTSLPTS